MTITKNQPAAADNAKGEGERVTSPTSPAAGTGTGSKATARRPRRMAREPKTGVASTNVPAIEVAISRPKTGGTVEPRPTKSAAVLALLQRIEGATLDQLVEATGWLPHTARAALTGLKKKGHAITSSKEEGQPRIYRAGQA